MTSLDTEGPAAVARLFASLVLAGALFSAMGVAVPTAHADVDDNGNFSGALSSKGITIGSAHAATLAGHQVCDELDHGVQTGDVANEVMTQTALDAYHAGFFVGVSIAAFCPRHGH